ncbi:polysaccharide export protein [Sulfuricella sp. T08]|uniref:polysaccharide biosynthesis/export family protein n=1 Tax=Sulfuricella sp. T08 TaxID=1632857 RepID=UPI00061799A9|nr:polysaccharide biosynthesis/export family protein [Sulfuricella sp. T08]GAO34653.1 polysaccharide export protein [Sulfuricella sp. T08]
MTQNFVRILFSIALGMMLSFGALAEQPEEQAQAEVVKVESVAMDAAAKVEPAVEEVDSGYQIGPEDVLEISVWKEEGLKKEALVRPDGGLSFPLIGEVQAAGKTVGQLKKEIAQRLEKFIPDPVVSIAFLKVGGNKIFVIGKVNNPGEFPAGRYVDVLQALSMAKGLTPFASENGIKIMRKEGGKDIVFPFRYSDVKNGEDLGQNIQLKGGDVVVVP